MSITLRELKFSGICNFKKNFFAMTSVYCRKILKYRQANRKKLHIICSYSCEFFFFNSSFFRARTLFGLLWWWEPVTPSLTGEAKKEENWFLPTWAKTLLREGEKEGKGNINIVQFLLLPAASGSLCTLEDLEIQKWNSSFVKPVPWCDWLDRLYFRHWGVVKGVCIDLV